MGISRGVMGVRGVLCECKGAPDVGTPGVEAERLGERGCSPPVVPELEVAGSRGLLEGLVELGLRPKEVALIKT
jgi:hypothetical protein